MAYKNGTYIAFDGNDTTNPTEGDMKYYGLLQAWNKSRNHDFSFSDSHKKTYQVSDESKIATLKSRLLERLNNSKNMIVIISKDTSWNRGLLNWEIEKAVDSYNLPLIVVYTEYSKIQNVDAHSSEWPKALKERIENNKVKCIHIPFRSEPIMDALSQFSINNKMPNGSKAYYSDQAYNSWGMK